MTAPFLCGLINYMGMEPRPLSELLEARVERRLEEGEAIRAARLQVGVSQQAFAAEAGISQTYLSQVENGHKSVSTDTLAEMQQAFAALSSTGGHHGKGKRSNAKDDAAQARKRRK